MKDINLNSCNMQSASSFVRAQKMEWEHIMPVENFGQHFSCWQNPLCVTKNGKKFKGRRCCEAIDEKFQRTEAELYNLWPSVGLVNEQRANYRFDMLDNATASLFYGCPIAIDHSSRRVEPFGAVKGIVARANLFMSKKYHVNLSDAQTKLFNAWDALYPPSRWEKEWALQVKAVEGYSNPYIDAHN